MPSWRTRLWMMIGEVSHPLLESITMPTGKGLSMAGSVDGFYAVYLSSGTGFGAAIFIIRDGKIAGADPHGVVLNGLCSRRGDTYKAKVKIEIAPGAALLQGGEAGPEGTKYEVSFTFDYPLDGLPFRRIETPMGPVNAKFVKVRGMDD